MITIVRSLLALVIAGSVVGAQCVAPGMETFDIGTTVGTAACSLTTPGTFPPGWSNNVSTNNAWRVWTGTTSSLNTGPTGDHTSGTGKYLYTETSCAAGPWVATLDAPCVTSAGLVSPAISFYYHMWGITMGMLELQVFDGSVWNTVWSRMGDQGNQWSFASVGVTPVAGQIQYRFVGTRGTSFESDMALDDITVGEAPTKQWEINKPEAYTDINGRQTDGFFAKVSENQSAFTCPPPATNAPAVGVITIRSSNAGLPWDLATNAMPLISKAAGAFDVGDGQLVNVDFVTGGIFFANGFLGANFPGGGFPGATSATVTLNYAISAATNVSMQDVHISPAAPLGFHLSQAQELNVILATSSPSVPGPTLDDANVTVNVTASPTCWCPTGVPFFGTSYSQIHVSSNGRVLFGGLDTDFSVTVAEALTDNPFVGYWTDLNPGTGGNITISSPGPGIVRADWNNVNYFTEVVGITFAIIFDCTSGTVFIDGLTGIAANPLTGITASDAAFLGMSGGNAVTATDPGITAFGLSGPNSPASTTAMIYDFNDAAVSAVGLPASLAGGTLNQLIFQPSPGFAPNYNWAGL